ncbi:hypothetical protein HYC85_003075 [Camellia sinensis]|uniref:Uncharacterized protein n=1 Tax=Camellia sinensis TaxID=4442 RepID=A0A7J7IBE0_CAMSI|nr:hypothetical protein HYC85_003075 [Camellia sinensis]
MASSTAQELAHYHSKGGNVSFPSTFVRSLPSIDVEEQGALDTFRYLLSIHASNDSTFSSMCPSLRLYRVIGAAGTVHSYSKFAATTFFVINNWATNTDNLGYAFHLFPMHFLFFFLFSNMLFHVLFSLFIMFSLFI